MPVQLVDVPGLVPGAHEGKGLGYQFLDDLRTSDGFIQVIDAAGASTPDGTIAPPGTSDPVEEVEWLEEELVRWIAGILSRDYHRHAKSVEVEGTKAEDFLYERLTGLSISLPAISDALRHSSVDRARPSTWTEGDRFELARHLMNAAKPRVVAANKADRIPVDAAADLGGRLLPLRSVPTCAEAELTLRRAARGGLVRYVPGEEGFARTDPGKLSAAQAEALDEIASILARYHGTGVQRALETMVFEMLHMIVVYPVEDEVHWTDSKGRVLPDAFLVPAATPARAMAYRVHSELGENFIRAIDGRTHRALAADHPLENGAVVRIVARR